MNIKVIHGNGIGTTTCSSGAPIILKMEMGAQMMDKRGGICDILL